MNLTHKVRTSGVLIVMVAVGAVCTAGCAKDRKQKEEEHLAARVVTVNAPEDAAAAEESATVQVGQLLAVRLPTQAGTGYSWRLVSGSAADSVLGLAQYRTEHELNKDGKPLVGGRVWDTFSFPASRQGTTTLEFVYDRAWEHKVPPARRYNLKVDVTQ